MGIQKYAICPHCGRELKRNRENFKRSRNKETGKEETILRKYDSFPKMFGKIFKDQKPQIVKDSKGNSWFEFAIPQNMQQMELSYKQGGTL